MKLIKYFIIVLIATGVVLSLVLGIEYECRYNDDFFKYYGSPFIFKKQTFFCIEAYYYSIIGLILNITIWSILISVINSKVYKLINRLGNKIIRVMYKFVVALLIAFSIICILYNLSMIGNEFKRGANYWYLDSDELIEKYCLECENKLIIIKNR